MHPGHGRDGQSEDGGTAMTGHDTPPVRDPKRVQLRQILLRRLAAQADKTAAQVFPQLWLINRHGARLREALVNAEGVFDDAADSNPKRSVAAILDDLSVQFTTAEGRITVMETIDEDYVGLALVITAHPHCFSGGGTRSTLVGGADVELLGFACMADGTDLFMHMPHDRSCPAQEGSFDTAAGVVGDSLLMLATTIDNVRRAPAPANAFMTRLKMAMRHGDPLTSAMGTTESAAGRELLQGIPGSPSATAPRLWRQ